jgi:hypothetical protein
MSDIWNTMDLDSLENRMDDMTIGETDNMSFYSLFRNKSNSNDDYLDLHDGLYDMVVKATKDKDKDELIELINVLVHKMKEYVDSNK